MKIVIIVNTELPAGLVVNTAAILGISLGKGKKQIVGPDCVDGSGVCHKGITEKNIPILAADSALLKKIYKKSIGESSIETIDFNQIAQGSRNYADYMSRLSAVDNQDIEYSGLCLSGPEKEIVKLTGSLRLYR